MRIFLKLFLFLIFNILPSQASKSLAERFYTGDDFRQKRSFTLPGILDSLKINLKHGTFILQENSENLITIHMEGDPENLKNIRVKQGSKKLKIIDKTINPFSVQSNTNVDLGALTSSIIGIKGTSDDILWAQQAKANISYRFISTMISSIRSGNPNVAEQSDFASLSTGNYGRVILSNVILENVILTANGRLKSGKVVKGFVKQEGKLYGPGSEFSHYKSNQEPSEPLPMTPEFGPVKETIITLLVPSRLFKDSISLIGEGKSSFNAKSLKTNIFNAILSDDAKLIAHKIKANSVELDAKNNSTLEFSGCISHAITLAGEDRARVKYQQCPSHSNFQNFNLLGKNKSTFEFLGNQAMCTDFFHLSLEDRSTLDLRNLEVTAIIDKPYFQMLNNAKALLKGCSFSCFKIEIEDRAQLKIIETSNDQEKSNKEELQKPELFSSIILKNNAEVILSNWTNKMKVKISDKAGLFYESSFPSRSLFIEAENAAKAQFKGTFKQAKVATKDRAEVIIKRVTEVLESDKSDRSEIYVTHGPQKRFEF